MRWAGPVNRADSVMVISRLLYFYHIFSTCVHINTEIIHPTQVSFPPNRAHMNTREKVTLLDQMDNLHYRLTFDLDNENEIPGKNLLRGS